MSHNTESSRQKNTSEYFGWAFQTLILHFYRGTVQGGGSDDRRLDSDPK